MPLWFSGALLGSSATLYLTCGLWLLMHLPDAARIFSTGQSRAFVRGTGRQFASPGAVWFAVLVFNGGWIARVLLWVFAIAGNTCGTTGTAG
ncbi:hypothetical protein [Alteriqipengyuania sp. 357]